MRQSRPFVAWCVKYVVAVLIPGRDEKAENMARVAAQAVADSFNKTA